MTKQDKATDARLRRKYGLSLQEYEQILEAQGGGCAICGALGKTRRLHVDHSHKFRYMKVETKRHTKDWWLARCGPVSSLRTKKNDAIRAVRLMLLRKSVRGIVCFSCNGGLRKFRDSAEFLANAARYLWKHGERNGR